MLPILLPAVLSCLAAASSVAGHVLPDRRAGNDGTVILLNGSSATAEVPLMVIGLDQSSTFLHFKAERTAAGIRFRLKGDNLFNPARRVGEPADPFALGIGQFYARVGAATVKCHLDAPNANLDPTTAPAQTFRFQNGADHGSYLYPCGFKDNSWVQVICEGPAATCDVKKWVL